MEDIKREYENLKKRHDLPDFNLLDKEFEISAIESTAFLLHEIRKRIAEKIEFFAKLLESILQPEQEFCVLYESSAFDDEEKKEIFKTYKKLMYLLRTASELAIEQDDKEDAKFISNALQEWNLLKKDLLQTIQKLKESWKNDIKIKSDIGYVG